MFRLGVAGADLGHRRRRAGGLYSAVTAGAAPPDIVLFKKQLIWYGSGIVVMIFCFLFDYKHIEQFANVIYLASVGTLLAVLLFGKYVGGSRRWLQLGPFSLQPSEMAKVAVIIVLARYYAKHNQYRRVDPSGSDGRRSF